MKKSLAVLLMCVAVPALAQFGSPVAKTDVQSIIGAPDDGQRVLLRGTIVGNMGDEEYLFTDGTGNIRLVIEDRLLWGQMLSKEARVEIEGEVDEHLFINALDISVERVQVLKGSAPSAISSDAHCRLSRRRATPGTAALSDWSGPTPDRAAWRRSENSPSATDCTAASRPSRSE
jgi:uncharacterized protein (TIGR00156 family)